MDDIVRILPHSHYGTTSYGAFRTRWEVWATTIPGILGVRQIEEVHFDIVLPVASPDKPIVEVTPAEHHALTTELEEAVRPLMALFVPRERK